MADEHRPRQRYGEAFWRAHHEAWKRSDLNQREYCEAQGIPLKAFGNWRAKFKAEPQPPVRKLLYRRGGLSHSLSHTLSHSLSHMTNDPLSRPIVPPARDGHRRGFSDADKRRIVEEAAQPGVRQGVRCIKSLPLVEAMKTWLEAELNRVPPRGGLADAIRYALTRWSALCRFLHDGHIELDNNTVERAIRPIALGRKNHLFAGSDGGAARWAIIASLLATAKLNDVEPFAYLKDVLERMSDGHPMSTA